MHPQPPKKPASTKTLAPAPSPRGAADRKMLTVLEKSFTWAVSDVQLDKVAGVEALMAKAQERKVNQGFRSLLANSVQTELASCKADLRAAKETMIAEAWQIWLGQTRNLTWLTEGQKDAIVGCDMDQAIDPEIAASCGGVFELFFYELNQWSWTQKRLTSVVTDCVPLIDQALTFQTLVTGKVGEVTTLAATCRGNIAAAKTRASTLLTGDELGTEVPELNDVLAGFLEIKAAEIGRFDEKAAMASLQALLKGKRLADLSDKSLQAQFRRFTEPLSFCSLEISGVLDSVQMGITGLSGLQLKPFHKNTLKSLLSTYRGPGFFALVALPAEQQKQALDCLYRVLNLFTEKVPPSSARNLILARLKTIIDAGPNVTNMESALSVRSPQIDLPDGVTSSGWQLCNQILVPQGFTLAGTDGVETDQACVKHVEDELGAAPDQVTLTAYFASMFRACREAGKIWTKNGRRDSTQTTIAVDNAIWNIYIGVGGKKIVYHIDSGYRESWWRKQA